MSKNVKVVDIAKATKKKEKTYNKVAVEMYRKIMIGKRSIVKKYAT